MFLSNSEPLLVLAQDGARSDPWRAPGRPTAGLTGLPAARIVRALIDFMPPYTLPELAAVADTSLGATYRLSDYLVDEGLVAKAPRGPVTEVDWSELLYRWSAATRGRNWADARGYLEPRGLNALLERLRREKGSPAYAVSGSLATEPYAPYAEPRLAMMYAVDPGGLAAELGLRPVEVGANVVVTAPRSPVVFERTTRWQGVTLVAPSQAAADLLGGPGRNPSEGDHLVKWMKENQDAWRRQLDR